MRESIVKAPFSDLALGVRFTVEPDSDAQLVKIGYSEAVSCNYDQGTNRWQTVHPFEDVSREVYFKTEKTIDDVPYRLLDKALDCMTDEGVYLEEQEELRGILAREVVDLRTDRIEVSLPDYTAAKYFSGGKFDECLYAADVEQAVTEAGCSVK